jgi:hypothetical protein
MSLRSLPGGFGTHREHDPQVVETLEVRHADQVRSRSELVIGDASVELLDDEADLEAGQVRPDAAVDAGPEGHVPVFPPTEIHDLRIRPGGRVSLGRAQVTEDPLAFANRHTRQLEVPSRGANQSRGRCADAKELLDGRRDERRLLNEQPPLIGVARQVGERECQRGRDGVQASEHEQGGNIEYLLAAEGAVAVDGDELCRPNTRV